mgnify:CR=1 FL=1
MIRGETCDVCGIQADGVEDVYPFSVEEADDEVMVQKKAGSSVVDGESVGCVRCAEMDPQVCTGMGWTLSMNWV